MCRRARPARTAERSGLGRQVTDGAGPGALSTSERDEIKALRARVHRLEEDNRVLRAAVAFFAGGTPWAMPMTRLRRRILAGTGPNVSTPTSSIADPGRAWLTSKATEDWVTCCNHDRLQGTLGMVPPIKYEAAHYTHHALSTESA
ncbi:hypothetical protein BN11_4510021 [Nostocoides australiense Ben110]|uniref:Transposase n=1 Tax=Nostocoides australiense Ben110 TaxID=1193182 RepID=W6K0J0_9MICO|nr:hypothetical protein BN11_4510021 [Tetrasphaera australiensis Ben110]